MKLAERSPKAGVVLAQIFLNSYPNYSHDFVNYRQNPLDRILQISCPKIEQIIK
jgi:hypothetical protein